MRQQVNSVRVSSSLKVLSTQCWGEAILGYVALALVAVIFKVWVMPALLESNEDSADDSLIDA